MTDPLPFDAFGFVTGTAGDPRELVTTVVEQVPDVRFACLTVGSTVAVVVAEVADLPGLRDAVAPQVADSGALDVLWTLGRAAFGMPVKRGRWSVGALVRVSETGHGGRARQEVDVRLRRLNEDEAAEQGFGYAAQSTFGGDCQLLVDVGAPDLESLLEVLDQLGGLADSRVVDTALYQLDEGAWAER